MRRTPHHPFASAAHMQIQTQPRGLFRIPESDNSSKFAKYTLCGNTLDKKNCTTYRQDQARACIPRLQEMHTLRVHLIPSLTVTCMNVEKAALRTSVHPSQSRGPISVVYHALLPRQSGLSTVTRANAAAVTQHLDRPAFPAAMGSLHD